MRSIELRVNLLNFSALPADNLQRHPLSEENNPRSGVLS